MSFPTMFYNRHLQIEKKPHPIIPDIQWWIYSQHPQVFVTILNLDQQTYKCLVSRHYPSSLAKGYDPPLFLFNGRWIATLVWRRWSLSIIILYTYNNN